MSDLLKNTIKSKSVWQKVAEEFFATNGPADHQISSFNDFMQNKLVYTITNSELIYSNSRPTQTPEDVLSNNSNHNSTQYILNFHNVYANFPEIEEVNGTVKKLKPSDCKIRGLTYSSKITADIIRYTTESDKLINTEVFEKVVLGYIPVMVGSNWCNLGNLPISESNEMTKDECFLDSGGYFIISGNERVLISQDRMAHNEIFVFKCKDTTSENDSEEKSGNKSQKKIKEWSHIALVRSYNEYSEPNITSTSIKITQSQLDRGEEAMIYIELPSFKEEVPWPVVMMALGVGVDAVNPNSDFENIIHSQMTPEMKKLLSPSIQFPSVSTQQQALEYLSNYVISQRDNKIETVKYLLRHKFLQNVNSQELKKYYIGHMTYQLLATVLNYRKEDDRDHYAMKRIETAGTLINNLFRSTWKIILREVKGLLEKKRSLEVVTAFYSKFTPIIKKAFATGNWTASKIAKNTKVGISQLLNRHNNVATISNLRRVITPSDKNNKIVKPRHLHSSHFYFICPAETPEGQATGLQKNMSMLSTITSSSEDEIVISWLEKRGLLPHYGGLRTQSDETLRVSDEVRRTSKPNFKVFVNGKWVGNVENPEKLVEELRTLRRSLKIPRDTSISMLKNNVRIYTDEGRLIAPFFRIANTDAGTPKIPDLPKKFTFENLIELGIIEYLDVAEAETLFISEHPHKLQPRSTHCLIHPAFIYGISASTTPFSNHNQSPRVIYQSSMHKQALGIPTTNFLERYDTTSHVLCYPQKPLVNNDVMRFAGTEQLPAGQNLILAIASYTGYNQEDSVIINRSSLDCGILRSFCYNVYSESNYKKGAVNNEIKKPENLTVKETRLVGYAKLDVDGVPMERTPICKRDIVIGKVSTTGEFTKDISTIVKVNGMEETSVVETSESSVSETLETSVNETTENEPNSHSPHSNNLNSHSLVYTVNPVGSAFVDRVILTTNEDSNKTFLVRTRQQRIPQIGDKVASRSAQKGIIGIILPTEDMPYCQETGMVPDIIMNPCGMPSRMTIAKILEMVLGKACSLDGNLGNGTPFEAYPKEYVEEILTSNSFQVHGDETMVNGMTGEEMECKIFIGPAYYQRLKHMVDDKIHSRSQNGPRDVLTRQAVCGRKHGGGFRMGEMETNCAVSHGVSNFLIDRLVNNSDGYEMYVCDDCGNTAIANIKNQNFECRFCDQNTRISKVKLPYAFKLLQQELQATGQGVWFRV